MKRFLLEAATLVAAAIVCAFVSNALAARDRKLAPVGSYPSARKVPERSTPSELSPSPAPAAEPTPAPAPSAPNTTASTSVASPPTAAVSRPPSAKPTPVLSAAKGTPASTSTAPLETADLAKRFPAHKDTPYVELHGDDVALLHRARALFLDARRSGVYAEGHIAGARSVSVWEADVDERVGALLAEGGHEKAPVVIYCSGGDCEDSHMLAQKLFGAGFENLYVYRDGWPDWQKRGLPGRTGATP
jgi:rhodanese-related sulfurtransferase